MWRLLVLILFSLNLNAQTNSVRTYLSWFDKSSVDTVSAFFIQSKYSLVEKHDSNSVVTRKFEKIGENGIISKTTLIASDTAINYLVWDVYGHIEQRAFSAQLKSLHFKQLGARLDGNYITTTYDNGVFLVEQGYQAVDHPEEKGQIPLFQFRMYRKFGPYDDLNGIKLTYELDKSNRKYLACKANFQNGVLHGDRTLYFPSGNIQIEENYANGRLTGKRNEYNEAGQLIHSASYSYDWHYGPEKWYNTDGEVIHTVNWQRDVKTGQEIEKKQGKIVRLITYKKGIPNGKALLPIYALNQDSLNDIPEMLEDLTFINGLKNGRFFRFHTATKDTILSGNYLNNRYHGTLRLYSQHKLVISTTYNQGIKDGLELTFENSSNSTGNVMLKNYFKHGLKDSVELLFVTNGPHKGDTARIAFLKNGKYYGQERGKFYPSYNQHNELSWKPYAYFCKHDSIQLKQEFSVDYFDSLSIKGHYVNNLKTSNWEISKKASNKITTQKMVYKNGILDGPFEKTINTTYSESGVYLNDKKEGIWVIIGDSLSQNSGNSALKIIANYKMGQLNGLRQFYDHELLLRQDSLVSNTLISSMTTNPNGFIAYVFDSINFDRGKAYFSVTERRLDTMIYYPIALFLTDENRNYLTDWHSWIVTNTSEITGDVIFETSEYHAFIDKEINLRKAYLIVYKTNHIHQYKTNKEDIWHFAMNKTPFTGELISTFDNCHYAIKSGVLHGWTTYFNDEKSPIKRSKFKNGKVKKVKVMI